MKTSENKWSERGNRRPPKVQNQSQHHPSPFPSSHNLCPHWGRAKNATLVNYWQTPFKITIYKRSEGAAWENLLHSSLWDWTGGSALAVSIHTDLGSIFSQFFLLAGLAAPQAVPHICLPAAPKFSFFCCSSGGWCHRWMTQKWPWLVLASVGGRRGFCNSLPWFSQGFRQSQEISLFPLKSSL